jgi:trk system potassium uptake protein TrkA
MRVAIAGAGAVGQSIAQALLADGHRVLLIERNWAAYRPDLVEDADWMLADACELRTLHTAAIHTCQVVVAASGDDKVNLVFAMLAKTDCGVPRAVARINNPANAWLFTDAWGIDVAVSTPVALASGLEEAVTVGELVRLITLQPSHASIVAITLPSDSPLAGMPLASVRLPADTAVLTIVRRGTALLPSRDSTLQVGDEILLATTPDQESAVRAQLSDAAEVRS